MIVVDANCFLRYVVQPTTTRDRSTAEATAALFRLAKEGREAFTTSDAVIAEVVFILSSARHYNVPRPDVVALLKPILRLRGCKLPGKRRCLRALDLWAESPRLSFVDALVAITARDLGVPVASFDTELGRVPGLTAWVPPEGSSTT